MSIVYEEDLVRDADGNLRDKDGNLLEKNGVWLDRNVRLHSREQDAAAREFAQEKDKEITQREQERLNEPGLISKFKKGIKKLFGLNKVRQNQIEQSQNKSR